LHVHLRKLKAGLTSIFISVERPVNHRPLVLPKVSRKVTLSLAFKGEYDLAIL